MTRRKADSVEDAVAAFEEEYPVVTSCKVCDSDYRDVVDELQRRGAGGGNLSDFLLRRFGLSIGENALRRHRRMHGVERPSA